MDPEENELDPNEDNIDWNSLFSDLESGRWDDDPNPYHGTYSED